MFTLLNRCYPCTPQCQSDSRGRFTRTQSTASSPSQTPNAEVYVPRRVRYSATRSRHALTCPNPAPIPSFPMPTPIPYSNPDPLKPASQPLFQPRPCPYPSSWLDPSRAIPVPVLVHYVRAILVLVLVHGVGLVLGPGPGPVPSSWVLVLVLVLVHGVGLVLGPGPGPWGRPGPGPGPGPYPLGRGHPGGLSRSYYLGFVSLSDVSLSNMSLSAALSSLRGPRSANY